MGFEKPLSLHPASFFSVLDYNDKDIVAYYMINDVVVLLGNCKECPMVGLDRVLVK
jgi:hypothetical protein